MIKIKTKNNLFEFNLTPEIVTKPYDNVHILHKIYKLNKGIVTVKNKEIAIDNGYFQLETLAFENN